ncbi:methyltransferase domain-containing protein [Kibdelosporangium philippinense]|uniref:Methyltransferase domain-containing protein n=1 Tax=Kibdelosporangium philippinense TaxID=211113 RepID=A0ABS8ZCD2_9PSEU|nr:class I SAM-dependent methyltransferase [Kibdelosporangium philippinense]MCE7005450.1 methyltransferase domain-containing protein [Kibdelosporangium philippinense]
MKTTYARLRRTLGQLAYEKRYGVRTAELIELDQLGIAGEQRGYYVAASWRTLRRTLSRKEVTARDVFIDFGSGMGRMVLEAARFPFGKVIGVELSDELHEIAKDNVQRTRQRLHCRDIELVQTDVLEYEIPDDVSVVFFNNPFQGPVFTTVIERLVATLDRNPRELKIIYYNPVEEQTIMATGRATIARRLVHARRRTAGSPFGVTKVFVLR